MPFIDYVDVSIMDEALPAFWTLNSNEVTYTYATLGYKMSNWARGLYRDQVLRRDTENPVTFENVMAALKTKSHASLEELVQSTGLEKSAVCESVIRGIQLGVVAPNAGVGGFQYRELFMETNYASLVYGAARDSGYLSLIHI